MSVCRENNDELRALLAALREDTISSQQADRLVDMLQHSSDARRMYIHYTALVANIHCSTPILHNLSDFLPEENRTAMITQPLGSRANPANERQETTAIPQGVPVVDTASCPHSAAAPLFATSWNQLLSGWTVAYLIATVTMGIGALIAGFTYVSRPGQVVDPLATVTKDHVENAPKTTIDVVGQITGMVGCKWANPRTRATDGAAVSLGRKYVLAAGLMEITYNSGARVILQGPVTYEVESRNGGFLPVGKLTGTVETTAAKGFAIRTPTAIVTDLGTEFGIEVDANGDTTSHVFRGAIEVLQVGAPGTSEDNRRVLRASESVRVERRDGRTAVVSADASVSSHFARALPRSGARRVFKVFDLADAVAGGDGFSERRNRGVNATNGRSAESIMDNYDGTGYPIYASDGRYHTTDDLPFVDGVFIPAGQFGPMKVDSAGHTFDGFSRTLGKTAGNVWAGGAIPVPTQSMPEQVAAMLVAASPSMSLVPTKMGGVDYSTAGHGLIFLHANKGITFDLDAIRRANPGCRPMRFRATVGNVEPVSEKGLAAGSADAWVLVDGQVRYRRREINGCSGAFPINYLISPTDRFLTLVASDGGNDMAGDWILFGDPVLEMVQSKETDQHK